MPTEDKDKQKAPALTHGQAIRRLEEITAELERLGELDDVTEQDETYFAELREEFASVDAHRKRLERDAELARVRAVSAGLPGSRLRAVSGVPRTSDAGYDRDVFAEPTSVEAFRGGRNPWDLSEMRTFSRGKAEIGQEFRARALAAIEKMACANDAVRQAGTDIIERWDDGDSTIAKLCLATSSPEYLRAWSKMAMNKGHMLSTEEQQAMERAMSLSDPAGGYLVPFQLDPTVIITANGSRNQIRQVARQVVATGDTWNGVSAGQVTWSWRAEAAEATDNSPTFAQPVISIYKANGFVPISIEALQDEANVTTEVARLLAFGRDVLEANAFTLGTGTAQPWGIVSALTGTGSEVAATTADTFASADVYKLDNALPARYRANATWLAHRSVYNAVRQFDTQGGAQMWERIGAGMPGELLGRPALEAEDMKAMPPTALAANMLLVYGDFDNYVIADRVGMSVEFIPHLFGAANRFPTGQRGWYAYYRVGADSVNDGAFRMLNA